MEAAGRISDQVLKQSFLENIGSHRMIAEAAAELGEAAG
jgi:hypothetical protein